MIRLLKNMKKDVHVVLLIIILLAVQAVFDLSLPDYTANIVNIGITQSGVENAAPEAVRKTEMDKILLLLEAQTRDAVVRYYELLSPQNASESQKENYPALTTEEIYVMNALSDAERQTINSLLGKPLLVKAALESESAQVREMTDRLKAAIPEGVLPEDATVFQILEKMPQAQRSEILSQIDSAIPVLQESQISQAAIAATVREYEAVGISVNSIRTRYILVAGLKMLGIALGGVLASVLVTLLSSRLAADLGRNLRSQVFHRVVSFSPSDMESFGTASLITRNTNDIQQIQMMITILFRMVIYAPILGIYGFVKVLNTDSSMSWIIGIGVLGISCLLAFLFAFAMPKFKLLQKLVDRLNRVAREILTGLPVIRAFSNSRHEEQRFDEANRDLTRVQLFVNRTMAIMMPTMMLIMNAVTLLIIWNGAGQVDAGHMKIGDLMAFMQYAIQVIMAFLMVSMVSILLPRASVSAKRIQEVLQKQPSILDPDPSETDSFVPAKRGMLEFRDVYFRYPGAEEDVLRNISFTAERGKTTAIIGSTGSGKSTLVNLIPRFYDATGGKILVNGADVRRVPQGELRKKLGFVPQKGVLFSGTVESNIKLGARDADEQTVKRAARIAQAEDFIEEKPDGYDSEISQGGSNVSGGQRQRLAIARAIAENPDIYVFDDSFSALDYRTDRILRRTLKEELSDATVIIVAQRINTILHADQIIVLDEGEIVGAGTHRELLESCDVYYQIASSQLSKEELSHE